MSVAAVAHVPEKPLPTITSDRQRLKKAGRLLSGAKGLMKAGGFIGIVLPPIGGLLAAAGGNKAGKAKKILQELQQKQNSVEMEKSVSKINTSEILANTSGALGAVTIGSAIAAGFVAPFAAPAVLGWIATPGAAFGAYINALSAKKQVDALIKAAK